MYEVIPKNKDSTGFYLVFIMTKIKDDKTFVLIEMIIQGESCCYDLFKRCHRICRKPNNAIYGVGSSIMSNLKKPTRFVIHALVGVDNRVGLYIRDLLWCGPQNTENNIYHK